MVRNSSTRETLPNLHYFNYSANTTRPDYVFAGLITAKKEQDTGPGIGVRRLRITTQKGFTKVYTFHKFIFYYIDNQHINKITFEKKSVIFKYFNTRFVFKKDKRILINFNQYKRGVLVMINNWLITELVIQ